MCGPQHAQNIIFTSANYRSNVIYIQKRIIAERRPTTTIVKLFLKRFNANRLSTTKANYRRTTSTNTIVNVFLTRFNANQEMFYVRRRVP